MDYNKNVPLIYSKCFFFISIFVNIILSIIIFATLNDKQIYVYFNSDTLYLPSIYRDLFIDNNTLNGWNLNGAPNFFPDMLMFFIMRSFFDHFIPAAFIFSLIQIIILLGLLSVFYKKMLPTLGYEHLNVGILLMTFFLLVTIVSKDFVYTFYIFSISYHTGAFLMALLSYIFLVDYIKKENLSSLIILSVVSVISVANDRLFLVMFSLPVFSLVVLLFKKTPILKKIYLILIVNAVSIILGILLFDYIKNHTGIEIISLSWKVFKFENIIPSFQVFLEQHLNYIKNMDFRGIINILFLISIVFHLVFLIKNLKAFFKDKQYIKYELIYLLIFLSATLSVLFMPVINGSYVSWAILRYNIFSFYLAVFSFSYIFMKLDIYFGLKKGITWAFTSFLLIYIGIVTITEIKNNNIREGLSDFMNYYPEEVACLDSLARKNDLQSGVATYWKAKRYTMFSRENLRIFTVFENLSPWYHVMNENWYYYEDGNSTQPRKFDFIITDNIDHKNIEKHLGIPTDTLYLAEDEEIFIFRDFIYNEDTNRPYIPR